MTETSPAPRGRRRSAHSHQAILRATSDLIREDGYSNLSIEAIAARAGVGKQTIYRWWPSKGAVAVDAFVAELTLHATWTDTGDFRADYLDHLRRFATLLADPAFGPHIAALTCEALHDPAVAEVLQQRVTGPSRAAHRERMARVQAAGTVRNDIDIDLAIDLMYAPFWFRLFTRAVPLSNLDPVALGEAVLRSLEPSAVDGSSE
ncbi:MAG: TetR/AcrR family transcriptional regulator [Chloroflexia bacterium]|nr:TetR/AcrR family transcriptional regulator [Chloroflexia bacterium]